MILNSDMRFIVIILLSLIYSTVTDIDGNVYETVQIGDQLWMAENLKVTHYNNGDEIPTGYNNNEWVEIETGAYSFYNNDTGYINIYGNLYNWYAVNDERNICPENWHIPSNEEFVSLTNFLGGNSIAGGKMKQTGYEYWNLPNTGATNESNFTGIPGGYRSGSGGIYHYKGEVNYLWTSSPYDNNSSFYRELIYNAANIGASQGEPSINSAGYSIRCLADETSSGNIYIPQDYPTIQEGINASADGDTVFVDDGVYIEFIDNEVNGYFKEVSIISINGAEHTTIRPLYDGETIIKLSNSHIDGFTIKDAITNDNGGAIFAVNSTINNCVIENNKARNGAGIYGSNILINNCILRNNQATQFPGNHHGGGIYISGTSIINSCSVYENEVSSPSGSNRGGGIYIAGGEIIIDNSQIYSNYLQNGGGYGAGIAVNNGTLHLSNTIISNNYISSSYGGGGGIAFETISGTDFITSTIRNCTIINNLSNLGDDIYLEAINRPCNVLAVNNIYNNNDIYEEGGGVYFTNVYYLTLNDCPLDTEYQLQEGSPCIDAGDPNSPLDPDGTIADIGAYYYHQEFGCTNPDASNYNPEANVDDGSCCVVVLDNNICYNIDETTEINLAGTDLDGFIRTQIGELNNLTYLDLSNNNLETDIPTQIGNLVNLTYLDLSNNNLETDIPSQIGNLVNLTGLSLHSNNLSGEIPDIGNLINLLYIDLSSNIITGEIPPEIQNLTSLDRLSLWGNQLTGGIPIEIGHLTNLSHLDLSTNQLDGEIPSELYNLVNLTDLRLDRNEFSGEIAIEIENLVNLNSLVLYDNQFTGIIPENICNQGDDSPSLFNNKFCPPYPPCIEDYIGIQETSECAFHQGDLTQDGLINVNDIVSMVNIVIEIFENDYAPSNEELQLGDIYTDGQLNVIDIVALVNIILEQ